MGKAAVLEGIKLVIFDVDGVIFDIVEAINETIAEGIQKYDLKVTPEDAMEEVGHLLEIAQSLPIPELVLNSKEILDVKFLEGFTVLRKLRIAASFYGTFRTKKESCGLFEGIADVISGLANNGYKLAILSNNKKSYILEALKKEDLAQYFTHILGFNEVSKTKPDPEGLLKILEMEGVDAKNALFIGDMTSDVKAGRNANINTIALASGLAPKAKLEAESPFRLVENVPALQALFGL